MIVIQQTPVKGALPQPLGPSSASGSRTRVAAKQEPKDVAGPSSTDSLFGTDEAGKSLSSQDGGIAGVQKRSFTRATTMFQQRSHYSSRSTSPLTSASSVASDASLPHVGALSTPASSLSSSNGATSRPRRGAALAKQAAQQSEALPPTPSQSGKNAALNEDPAAIVYDVPKDVFIPPFARATSNAQRDLARVWEAVASARRIAVICGAGISVSSPANIPDFRSAQGLFRKLKEKHPNVGLQSGKDLFDASLFNSSTTSACFYSMISELKAMADAASPTTFHHLLKRLDMEGRLMRVYTQNIDGLEEKAGLTFGLGEAGDSRSTLRALGKRKREVANAAAQRKSAFSRSKSEPTIKFGRNSDDQDSKLNEPMFPRAIPLHGSLSTMTCQVCSHKIYLDLASSGPQRMPPRVRQLSPDASDQAVNALDMLSQGEGVVCKHCEAAEQVRAVAGLRSRGIGMMKVDVVLYNGQNDGAERVGDCVERDILGLRDPNETAVPESHRERLLRERKERKDHAKKMAAEQEQTPVVSAEPTKDFDAFAEAFFEDQDDEDAKDTKLAEQELLFGSQGVLPAVSSQQQEQTGKSKRQARLKPLPPDLLIVAGTSLKVPGTKRLVREFAKACQAQDYREYESSDEEAGDNKQSSQGKRSRGSSPRDSRSTATKKTEDDEDEDDDEDDVNAPIRTILLNYDFPLPHTQWEDVFDIWVQGDVQQAALGLWESTKYPADQVVNDFHMASDEHHDLAQEGLSWASLQSVLEDERKAAKKAAAATAKKPSPTQKTDESVANSQQSSQKASKRGPMTKAKSQSNVPPSPKKAASSAKGSTSSSQTKAKSAKATAKPTKSATSSPVKKKAKSPASALDAPPPAVNAGLKKYMKGSTKASLARVQSAPSAATAKAKKAAA